MCIYLSHFTTEKLSLISKDECGDSTLTSEEKDAFLVKEEKKEETTTPAAAADDSANLVSDATLRIYERLLYFLLVGTCAL